MNSSRFERADNIEKMLAEKSYGSFEYVVTGDNALAEIKRYEARSLEIHLWKR